MDIFTLEYFTISVGTTRRWKTPKFRHDRALLQILRCVRDGGGVADLSVGALTRDSNTGHSHGTLTREVNKESYHGNKYGELSHEKNGLC